MSDPRMVLVRELRHLLELDQLPVKMRQDVIETDVLARSQLADRGLGDI